jgi:hypothetical protein
LLCCVNAWIDLLKKSLTLIAACGMLAACGDPLSKVDKLSSVELAPNTETVMALPDPAKQVRAGGLFSGLFNRDPAPVSNTPAIAQTDAAVSEALGVATPAVAPAVANVAASAEAPQVAAAVAQPVQAVEPERRGLFGFMRAKEAPQPAQSVGQIVADAPSVAAASIEQAVAVEPEKVVQVTQAAPEATAQPRRGLFGLLAGARAKEQSDDEIKARTAALTPTIAPKTLPRKTPRSNTSKRKHKGPDAQIVAFGTSLPPGMVARVCDLPGGRLGKEIEKFPTRGRGYKLIDSKPGSSGTRPFYVTGFDDNCARTFTAALALFGSPTMHEQLRYGLPSKVQPYSLTDQAYEGIKRSVCGASKNKPCGEKITKLEKNTVFISMYDRIGSNASWSNILIHDGWVLAADRKG